MMIANGSILLVLIEEDTSQLTVAIESLSRCGDGGGLDSLKSGSQNAFTSCTRPSPFGKLQVL